MNGKTGLANIGNSCYLNSCMQILSHTHVLNDFLDKKTYECKMNKVPDSLILREWDKLRKLMWSEDCTIAPYGFLKAIRYTSKQKNNDMFSGNEQNDIQEFLLFIIECFHNSLSREVEMKITGTGKNDVDDLAVKCYNKMISMYKNDYSEFLNMFYGINVNVIKDVHTNKIINQIPEAYSVISVSLPNKKNISLFDCLDGFCNSDEQLEYTTDDKKKILVCKNLFFWNIPSVFMIHLKRWNYNGRKNNNLIDIPIDNVDFSKYVKGYKNDTYVITYMVYVTILEITLEDTIPHPYVDTDEWYEFNDTLVSKIEKDKLISSQSYVLFYRKIN